LKFEQLLQIYWSRGFFYGGKIRPFDVNFSEFFYDKSGLNNLAKKKLIQRFELNFFSRTPKLNFNYFSLNQRKIINMYVAQLSGVNNDIFELIKFNMIRLYLNRTFRGRCFALGKPSRGQRTRSNASNAYKCNRTIRFFISQVKKINVFEQKPESLNQKWVKKKPKNALKPKIRMFIIKKKKSLILINLRINVK
jgi:ribosomal protein S13